MARTAPGNYVGELGPILNLPRSASVRALEDTVVTGYTVRAFRQDHPHHVLEQPATGRDARPRDGIRCVQGGSGVPRNGSEGGPRPGAGMSGTGPAGAMSPAVSAEPRLEIRVLGPVEIAWDGRTVDIGGAKARALVARLLIDRSLVVSVDRLVDSLWGEQNGHGARIALRSTISRVRKRLQAAGAPDELIVTRAPGYLLEVPGRGRPTPPGSSDW